MALPQVKSTVRDEGNSESKSKGIDAALADFFEQRVPRYTSYPPATQFKTSVGAEDYRSWLSALDRDSTVSLYVHVPFCESLCTYCGCHTTITRDAERVARYANLLRKELALVAATLGPRRRLTHLHWGGGTPSMLSVKDFLGLTCAIRYHFDISPNAEIAIEIDPRHLRAEHAEAMAAAGVNRASLGIQDFDPEVQAEINRIQPIEKTLRAMTLLRKVGIDKINFDLIYGLPKQTVASVQRTVEMAVDLAPSRISLFGYAHVPWMRKHQRMIDEASLPQAHERLEQYRTAANVILGAGYVAIGLDHFARADDPLAKLLAERRVHRNFQGYTSDNAAALIGLGCSAISYLPQGYVQNAPVINEYRERIEAGDFAQTKGLQLTDDDRQRAALIEQLMCYLTADLSSYGLQLCESERQQLARLEKQGLLTIDGNSLSVPNQMRPFVRTICAAFDRRSAGLCGTRHSLAV